MKMKFLGRKMQSGFLLVIAVVFSIALPAWGERGNVIPAAARTASSEVSAYVPGEILVKFKAGAKGRDISAIHAAMKTELKKAIPNINVQVVRTTQGRAIQDVIKEYVKNPSHYCPVKIRPFAGALLV